MFHRYLIFADNEGCIVTAKGTEFNLEKLSRLKTLLNRSDVLGFCICTGRSVPFVEAMTQVLGIQESRLPQVCEGGGVLYWPSEDRIQSLVEPFPTTTVLDRLPRDLFRVETGKSSCLTLYPEQNLTVSQLADIVIPLVDTSRFTLSVSAAAVDITHRGVDKGFGIKRALELIQHEYRSVVAIGDADNDLPMFDVADHAAAPSNATAAVKARANYVSRLPDTDGLIDILENLK